MWFFAGFSSDAVILTVLAVVLTPWMITRWMEKNLFDVIEDILADPRTNRLLQDYVVKRLMGNLGGRPKGLKGMIAQFVLDKFGGQFLGGEPPPPPPP